MIISLGPFITCSIVILILTVYFYITLYKSSYFSRFEKRLVFVGSLLVFLRMAVPINFPFTYSIYSTRILTKTIGFLYSEIPNSKFLLIDVLCLVWIFGVLVQLFRFATKQFRFNKYIQAFRISKEPPYTFLYEIAQRYTNKPINIVILPFPVSPSITGLFKPTIILPDIATFTKQDLEHIFAHEITHYTKHDLWLLLLTNIVCCIHWWNPLVYFMKKGFVLIMEVSNDQSIINSKNAFDRSKYAELILKIAKYSKNSRTQRNTPTLDFVGKSTSNLQTRIKFLYADERPKRFQAISRFCQIIFIFGIILFSFVIVTEVSFPVSDEELGCISITSENAYFIKYENTYELYVDGNFCGNLDSIPNDLRDIPINDKEDK